MKLTTLIMITVILHVSATALAQKVTLNEKNARLVDVFNEINAQTGYDFVFTTTIVKDAKPVTINIKNEELNDALTEIFRGQDLDFSLDNKIVVIKSKEVSFIDNLKNTLKTEFVVPITITGKVTDTLGTPLISATILNTNSKKSTITNDNGEFRIDAQVGDILSISFIGYKTANVTVGGTVSNIAIALHPSIRGLTEVVVNNGYQKLSPEKTTGSYNVISNDLINRSISTGILDRIKNLTPGLLFNYGDAAETDPILIRGRSTIFANAAPLIVVDNFEYDGDINNINPNDVENVTILKDAAAASIWGARAGNGVIVITTKKGKTAKPSVEFNSSVTVQGKENLFNVNTISGSDYANLEKYLYSKGYYSNATAGPYYPAETPVVQTLLAASNGTISQAQANSEIAALANHDVRNDEEKYLYQNPVNQQYSLNVSGNTPNINYIMSAGWDHNLGDLISYNSSRISLRSQNTFKITKNLEIDAGISYVQQLSQNGNNPGNGYLNVHNFYPYAALAGPNGNPLPVSVEYGQAFLQNMSQAGISNWSYNPIADIYNENNKVKTRDNTVNVGLRYKILNSLSFNAIYKYENQLISYNNFYNDSSYYARDLENSFAQIDPSSGAITYPIPQGGILNTTNSEISSNQGRAQLNFNQTFGDKHNLTAIAGYEIRSVVTTSNSSGIYGYNPNNSTLSPYIDYSTFYQESNSYNTLQIPNNFSVSKATDHFLSYYANAAYTFNNLYSISASARKDEANLFGVAANQKGTPLWSLGGKWLLNNASFYKIDWLPLLDLRATYGYNGNISRLASSLPTAISVSSLSTPTTRLIIESPPNSELSWERDGQLNLGIDFSTKNNILSGTIDYYSKNDKNLLGSAPVDPTLGISSYYGNVAAMKGKGVDIQLNSININSGSFKWMTNFNFSYSTSKVTKYLAPVSNIGFTYIPVNSSEINPAIGKPVFALYSYKWNGLDHNTGDPMGYLHGKPSEDWASIVAQTPLDSMVYNGPATPTYFGSFRNTFTYKRLSFSFNISYYLDYYFRNAATLNYGNLFASWSGSGQYAQRWQKPGDELTTNVPSLVYPYNSNRDIFYQDASINVLRADNIRLEDITLSYVLNKSEIHQLPFSLVRFSLYASNLGTLWVANKEHIDPYYNNTPNPGKSLGLRVNVNF